MSEPVSVGEEAVVLDETKPSTVNKTDRLNKTEYTTDVSPTKNSSYYYWHSHEKERAKVGDVAPMLTPVLISRGEMADTPVHVPLHKTVKKYQWCDEGLKTVSVYVQVADEAGEELDEDSVKVEIFSKSVRVSFSTQIVASAAQNYKQLHLSLAKKVNPKASSYRIKSSKKEITLKLMKAQDGTWFDLVGTPASDSDDEEDGVNADLTEDGKTKESEEDMANRAE
ncbi:unnamed protein product [Phytomonas sp. Hart1]|eukprot:CCW67706.1 unnamed protein product [Phytomonas sp. isolate Hart1]